MKDIVLHIRGSQTQGTEQDEVEFTTQGTVQQETDDKYVLTYQDTDSDDGSITTVIHVDGNVVSMHKIGAVETHFIFERDKLFSSSYITPYGSLDIHLFPTLVDAKMGQESGNIELEYVLTIAGTQVVNRLYLDYWAEPYGS